MKQIIKIIRKVDMEKQYQNMLNAELDYQLLSLHEAMQAGNETEKDKIKKELHRIQSELNSLKAYA